MGLTAGVVMTERKEDTPKAVCQMAEPFIQRVGELMQSAGDHANISKMLGELEQSFVD